jgi:two-component system, LytTR family, sensor kinase
MNSVLTGVIVTVVALVLVAAAVLAGRWLRRRMLDPPGVRSAAQALWPAGLAAPPLREGLTPRSAAQALPYLLALLETSGWRSAGPTAACWVPTAPADTKPTRSPRR